MHFEYILLTLDKSVRIQKHLHSPASHLNFCSFLHKHTPTHMPYIQPCRGQRSSPISCCPGRPSHPPRTSMAVYRRRPWHLLYPLHFNTGQETDWESGDANEISPPQLPSSILSGYCLHPGHINQTVRERGGGLKEEKGGRDRGRWSGGEKRETGLMAKLSSSRSSR